MVGLLMGLIIKRTSKPEPETAWTGIAKPEGLKLLVHAALDAKLSAMERRQACSGLRGAMNFYRVQGNRPKFVAYLLRTINKSRSMQ